MQKFMTLECSVALSCHSSRRLRFPENLMISSKQQREFLAFSYRIATISHSPGMILIHKFIDRVRYPKMNEISCAVLVDGTLDDSTFRLKIHKNSS